MLDLYDRGFISDPQFETDYRLVPKEDACVIFEKRDGWGDPFNGDPAVDWEDFKSHIEDWDWTEDFRMMTRYYEEYLNE